MIDKPKVEKRQLVRDPNEAASAEPTATATKTPSAEEANNETPASPSANTGSEEPCDDGQTQGQSRTNRQLTARPGDEENEDVWFDLDAVEDEPPSPTIPEKAALRNESSPAAGPDVGSRPAPQDHALLELILNQPKLRLWLKIEKGNECTPHRVIEILSEAREAYEKSQTQIEMLKNQIEGAGLKPVEEVTTLEEAEEKLQSALAKLLKGDESATEDCEKWGVIVESHPETKIKKENEAREWLKQNQRPNEEALRLMRSFIPPDIRSCSKAQLEARGVPEKIAKRVFDKKALWFCRMDPAFISKMHAAVLCSKYAYQGLDLTEMRAVFASIPETFENDGDGKKKKYRMDMQQKLKDLTAKEANGGLTGNNLRNRVYSAQTIGRFDPDDAIVKETVSAGEKMEQKDAWLESKQRSNAGGLAKSGARGESKRAEDTLGEDTFNTDGKPPKPRRPLDHKQKSAHSGSARSRPAAATAAGLIKAQQKLMNSKIGALFRKSGQ